MKSPYTLGLVASGGDQETTVDFTFSLDSGHGYSCDAIGRLVLEGDGAPLPPWEWYSEILHATATQLCLGDVTMVHAEECPEQKAVHVDAEA